MAKYTIRNVLFLYPRGKPVSCKVVIYKMIKMKLNFHAMKCKYFLKIWETGFR